jgi:two-component system sensor histidine kinase VicK
VKISDTGYGVPKAQQNRLFTKFFRGDNVRQRQTDGTGLGLYIAKSILDHSSGAIWFESEENKGTTFFVAIPLSGMKEKSGIQTLLVPKIGN